MNERGKKKTESLIVFTRFPELGKVKTRLIPMLGAKGAMDFQKAMTQGMLRN